MIRPWVYFREYDIAFAFIPKVANTAMKIAFAESLGRTIPDKAELIHRDIVGISPNKIAGTACNKYMFVRNPFDRLVSAWQSKLIDKQNHYKFYRYGMKDNMSFGDFARIICNTSDNDSDHHWRSQTFEMYADDKKLDVMIGKFESLELDWGEMQRMIPALPNLQIVGASQKKDYRLYYDDKLISLVSARYKKDLKELGYKFG